MVDARFCSLCGEDCLGEDYVSFPSMKIAIAGERGNQRYMVRGEDGNDGWDYLHRWCVETWLWGFFARLSSRARFPGDD